jgi:hypothetical protein
MGSELGPGGSPEARKRWQAPAGRADEDGEDLAGEPACLAHLVCPACGGVITEGHQPGCQYV